MATESDYEKAIARLVERRFKPDDGIIMSPNDVADLRKPRKREKKKMFKFFGKKESEPFRGVETIYRYNDREYVVLPGFTPLQFLKTLKPNELPDPAGPTRFYADGKEVGMNFMAEEGQAIEVISGNLLPVTI